MYQKITLQLYLLIFVSLARDGSYIDVNVLNSRPARLNWGRYTRAYFDCITLALLLSATLNKPKKYPFSHVYI